MSQQRADSRQWSIVKGLNYISSWVDHDLTTCYQIMQTADRELLDRWIANWSDLVDFEVQAEPA